MVPPAPQSRHVQLFRNNRKQAVRFPVEFELPGDEAIMTRDGDRLIVEPVRKRTNLVERLDFWRTVPPLGLDDDFAAVEDQPPQPEDVL